jgi:hypothetical protein
MRGHLSEADLEREHQAVATFLQEGAKHLQDFLAAWQKT